MRLYKRGRIWWTWYYPDGKRKDVSTRCRDKRAAALVARQYERLAAAPPDPTANQTSLAQACEHFRVDRRNRGRSPDTLRFYATKLGHLLRVFGSEISLDDIDAVAVDAYLGKRLDEGASRSTVAKELGTLRGVLRLAKRMHRFAGDVGTILPEGWSAGYVPRKRSLTHEQARKLIAALPPGRAAHVAFLLVSGARWKPSTKARRRDFDLERGLVEVRGTKTPGALRTVPVFEHVADLAVRAFTGAAESGPAYALWGNVRRDLAAACKRAGVPVVTPNDLRRTASTWLTELGAPSSLIAYFLGHTTSRMVEIVYGRVDGERMAAAFASLGIETAAANLQRKKVAKRR